MATQKANKDTQQPIGSINNQQNKHTKMSGNITGGGRVGEQPSAFENKVEAFMATTTAFMATTTAFENKVEGFMDTMTATMAKMQNTLEEFKTESNAKFDRLIAATPGAADIPAVFVPGDQDAAQRRGSKSTWTLVQSPYGNNGRPAYLLVSTAHCVHSLIDGQEKETTERGETWTKTSLLPLDDNVAQVLMKESGGGGVKVTKVGFHKHSERDGFDLGKQPYADIVFLEIEDVPPAARDKGFKIPIIPEPGDLADSAAITKNVAGTALSGCVNGHGLQFMQKWGIYSFRPVFAEPGCSGTVMFCSDVPVGCFKGTHRPDDSHERGRIVPFPSWGDIVWYPCKKQLRPFGNFGQAETPFDNGLTKASFLDPQPVPRFRPYYLTLERKAARRFEVQSSTFGTDEEDDSGLPVTEIEV